MALFFAISAYQTTASPLPSGSEGNSNSNAKPGWIVKLPQATNIIYGVGSATIYSDDSYALKNASESARAELAKSIRVNVAAITKVKQSSDNGKMSFYFDEAITNSVPEMELAGLKIADNYFDNINSTVYVLASFNKKEAIIELGQLLTSIDSELALITIDLADAAGQKLAQAIQVKKLLFKRRQYNDQLANLRQAKIMLPAHGQDLLTKSGQVFNNITFGVFSKTDRDLQEKIVEAITDQGLRVNNRNADFYLTYRIKWRGVARNNLFYTIASATVTLKNGDTVLRKFKQKAKGTSSDEGMARDKAVEKIGEQFAAVLSKELIASFQNAAPSASKSKRSDVIDDTLTYQETAATIKKPVRHHIAPVSHTIANTRQTTQTPIVNTYQNNHSISLLGVVYTLKACLRNADIVTCNLIALNRNTDQKIYLYRRKSRAIDFNGTEYPSQYIGIGGKKLTRYSSVNRTLVQGIPIVMTVQFTPVNYHVSTFALLEIKTHAGNLQYRNVGITN
ncbi:MAG: LPP20 family lipoprotein [Colwellia sp.]|nr:LPP20 family lipoprotein [Colwellia sp.]